MYTYMQAYMYMYMYMQHIKDKHVIVLYDDDLYNCIPLRGDFKVMFPGSEAKFTAGVFFLLENACKELANVSHQLQKRMSDRQLHGKNTLGSRMIYSNFVYTRMLWGKYMYAFFKFLCLTNSLCWVCEQTTVRCICHVCACVCNVVWSCVESTHLSSPLTPTCTQCICTSHVILQGSNNREFQIITVDLEIFESWNFFTTNFHVENVS